jgi:hypothetical protein
MTKIGAVAPKKKMLAPLKLMVDVYTKSIFPHASLIFFLSLVLSVL